MYVHIYIDKKATSTLYCVQAAKLSQTYLCWICMKPQKDLSD